MGTNKITVDYINHAERFQMAYRSPKRRLTTTWVETDRGSFWIHLAIIGPVSQQTKNNLSFGCSKAYTLGEAIADLVESLEEQLGTQDSVR